MRCIKEKGDQQGLEQEVGPKPAFRSRAGSFAYHFCLIALTFGVVSAFQTQRTPPDRRHLPETTDVQGRTLSNHSGGRTIEGEALRRSARVPENSYDRLDELLKYGHQSSLAEAGCILSDLATRDPERALTYLLGHDWDNIPPSLKTLLTDIWAEMSYGHALIAIRGCPDLAVRTELECRMIHSLSRVDPARAFELWMKNGEVLESLDTFRTLTPEYEIFNNWVRLDQEAAITAIEAITDEEKQSTARRAFVIGLAAVDLDEALQYVGSLAGDSQRALLIECCAELRKREPPSDFSSVEKIYGMLPGEQAGQFLVDMAPAMIRSDPTSGLVGLLALGKSSEQLHSALNGALTHVGTTSAQSVIQALEQVFPVLKEGELSSSSDYAPFLVAYVNAVSAVDARKGLELLERVPALYNKAGNAVLLKAFSSSPEEAMAFISRKMGDSHTEELATQLLKKWNSSSPKQAMEWALKHMPWESTIAQDLRLASLSPLLAASPEEYAVSLGEIAPMESEERSSAYWTLVSSWADKDPQQAANWISNIDNQRLEGQMADALSKKWARSDPMAASAWIRGLPEGSVRDIAIKNLVTEIRDADPKNAAEWSKLINSRKE